MIEQFGNSCLKLLSLMHEGILEPVEEGHRNNGERIASYKDGYSLELHKLIDVLFEFDMDILENNSREYIEKKINEFLFDCFFDGINNKTDKIYFFFNQLKNELRQSEIYCVPLLIENISLYSEITIGKVKFLRYSDDNYRKIFEEAGYPIENGFDLINIDTKAPFMKRVHSIGVVTVSAREDSKAIEKGEELIEQGLNILRLFNMYYDFGIVGKYNHPWLYNRATFNISTKSLYSHRGWSGDISGCRFTKDDYDHFKDIISNIDAVLKKSESDRKTMENKLLLALNWFGEIQKNRNHNDNIIRIFTALEALLVNKNEAKGDNIAKRLAFINYPEKEKRLFVCNLVKKMYKHRNELVHEGKTKFKKLDYNTLLMQLRLGMITIAKHLDKYPNLEDWIKLINEAKFDKKLPFQ